MLLTITSTSASASEPATDLGYLLHKNPAAIRSVAVAFGLAHVFYPEAGAERCTAALLVEVDPVGLVRRDRGGMFPLAAYVNDRPYTASSLLSVALRRVYGTAISGRCAQRPELVDRPLKLEARVPVLACHGGEDLLRRLFGPLGYEITAAAIPLDERFPEWGQSRYFDVRLAARTRVRDLLGQLYVLLPVLDDEKHYWVSEDEIAKLLGDAGDWLAGHPERDLIVRRYLRRRHRLVAEALARLTDEDSADPEAEPGAEPGAGRSAERAGEPGAGCPAGVAETAAGGAHPRVAGEVLPLWRARHDAVLAVLRALGARRVLDLGCGDGRLLAELLRDPSITEIVGVDVSPTALERAGQRLRLEEMAPRQRERITLLQGALTYRDQRLAGYDAAVLMEVIEHLDPPRLAAFGAALFGHARPAAVIVTTPNSEYNARYESLAPGRHRHPDHRFEWDRAAFGRWATGAAARYGYGIAFHPVGDVDPELGPATQMAVLTLVSEPEGRGGAWTDERGASATSEEGRLRPERGGGGGQVPRRRAADTAGGS